MKAVQIFFKYLFLKNPVALVSFGIFFTAIFAIIVGPFILPYSPYDPNFISLDQSLLSPGFSLHMGRLHLLGTDNQGRDMLGLLIYGLRASLIIGVFAVILQILIGGMIGLIAGYFGGKLDNILMRIADIQLSFSNLMLAIIIVTIVNIVLGQETFSKYAIFWLVVILGIADWPQFARTIRSSTIIEKNKDYVVASQIMGMKGIRIIFRHVLPNVLSPVFVVGTYQLAVTIMNEAALSFLGLGMPVTRPSLGSLISAGFAYIFSGKWWIMLFPGLTLFLVILSVNLIGDFYRDYFNPNIVK